MLCPRPASIPKQICIVLQNKNDMSCITRLQYLITSVSMKTCVLLLSSSVIICNPNSIFPLPSIHYHLLNMPPIHLCNFLWTHEIFHSSYAIFSFWQDNYPLNDDFIFLFKLYSWRQWCKRFLWFLCLISFFLSLSVRACVRACVWRSVLIENI